MDGRSGNRDRHHPIVGEGVNEVIDFGFTNKITLSGENKWGGTKADILGNLGDWTDKVLTGGLPM